MMKYIYECVVYTHQYSMILYKYFAGYINI